MTRIFLIASLVAGICFAGESRIELVTIHSPALGISKSFNIYLPEGYDERSDRYPVVYLFRGHEKEWVDGRGGRNIKEVADELFQAGKIGRMILVMPGLTSEDESIMSFAINFIDESPARGVAGIGTGKFEDYMIQDLIPYVDSTYRTISSGTQRGTDGASNGGAPAIMLAVKHPDMFSSVGSYDGVVGSFLDFDDPNQPGPLDDNAPTIPLLDPHFGPPPRDLEYMKQYVPANLIRYAEGERLAGIHALQFMLHSVPENTPGSLRDGNLYFVDLIMANQGLRNAFGELSLSPQAMHDWPDAYRHMEVTLPLHWQKFQNPTSIIPVVLTNPVADSEVSGEVEIRCSIGASSDSTQTTIFYSSDAGDTWHELTTFASNDSTYLWNTTEVSDGARYRLRVIHRGKSSVGVVQTQGLFTVNNPGNAAPEIELLSPLGTELISGAWPVRWRAKDADGDGLTFSMDYSEDGGSTWNSLFSTLQNTGEYLWDSRAAANSPSVRILLRCWDGTVEAADTSWVFEVRNERMVIPPELINHVSGKGGGMVTANVVDRNQLTGALYRITFDDSTSADKSYDVLNVDTGQLVVDHATQLNGAVEGPYFDGLRLLIQDFARAVVDHENSGWISGVPTWRSVIVLPTIDLGNEILQGYPQPADYKLTLFDHVVDTSSTAYGAPAIPMKFTVRNLTENRRANVIFVDTNGDQAVSLFDEIFILEPDPQNNLRLTWSISFAGSPNDLSPQPGDEFVFKTLKPITKEDVYEFRAILTALRHQDSSPLPGVLTLFPNYPNPFNPTTTIRYYLPKAERVKVAVYNLLGQEIVTLLEGQQLPGLHSLQWDGKDKRQHVVASGVYFYKIVTANQSLVSKMLLMR